jgi:hypothetical protein
MKAVYARSMLAGCFFMLLLLCLSVVAMFLFVQAGFIILKEELTPAQAINLLPYSMDSLLQLAFPVIAPPLFLLIVLCTWLAVRGPLKDVDPEKARSSSMVAVWISATISTLPIFISVIHQIVWIASSQNFAAGKLPAQMSVIQSAVNCLGMMFLVVLSGLIARLFPNHKYHAPINGDTS